jgi:hypothetical protein
MQNQTNPYASPMAMDMSPVAVQWLQTPSTSLTKVANGLGLIYTGICVTLLSAIGGPILMIVDGRSLGAVGLMLMLIGLGVIAGLVLNIVGSIFCLSTPPETGAQGLIYTSVGAMGLGLLITVGSWIALLTQTPFPQGLSGLQQLLNLVAGITFMLFLRKLALFIGRMDLAGKAKSILIWCCICIGLFIASLVLMIGSAGAAFLQGGERAVENAGTGFGIGGMLALAAVIIGLITFVRYANLLTYMKKAILSGGRG